MIQNNVNKSDTLVELLMIDFYLEKNLALISPVDCRLTEQFVIKHGTYRISDTILLLVVMQTNRCSFTLLQLEFFNEGRG